MERCFPAVHVGSRWRFEKIRIAMCPKPSVINTRAVRNLFNTAFIKPEINIFVKCQETNRLQIARRQLLTFIWTALLHLRIWKLRFRAVLDVFLILTGNMLLGTSLINRCVPAIFSSKHKLSSCHTQPSEVINKHAASVLSLGESKEHEESAPTTVLSPVSTSEKSHLCHLVS